MTARLAAVLVGVLLAACDIPPEALPRDPPLDQTAGCRDECDHFVLDLGGDPAAYASQFCGSPEYGCACVPVSLVEDGAAPCDTGAPWPPAPP